MLPLQYEDGERNGSGTLTFPNGDVYVGRLIVSLPPEISHSNLCVLLLEFKAGKRSGKGKYTYSSGNIYDGEWVNDKKQVKLPVS